MTIPSNDVRDYPNMKRTADEMFSVINARSPYRERDTHNLIVVRYYYVDQNAFVAEYDFRGEAGSMSIEFGSRGRRTGLKNRKDPPFESIFRWVEKKGLHANRRRSKITGRYLRSFSLKQVTYGIMHHIGELGTRPKGWGRALAEEIFERYEERFSDAFAADVEYQVNKYYPDLV